ncbi:chalcone isomerase family protein [Caenimonas sedimenti]|uniref:chalcone isomerase family protein n=1 Tax=Caenimonas sedimenti TaxID=2596921 RepID=UPI0021080FC3|nr:chalcone isomerase family protein [Caenimonas sedimenti]
MSAALARRSARGLLAACLLAGAAAASANDLFALEPGLRPAGTGRLTWFGFQAYDARLWVGSGFSQAAFERSPFALELAYLRAFTGPDIARRSLDEMRRAGPIAPEDAQRWQAALQQLLPDVQPGDRILGLHRPGRGAAFAINGTWAGEILDARFARLFFGIWLAPTTSEPKLRQALLAGTPP